MKLTAIWGRKSSLLSFATPKLRAEQCCADRDSAWDPGSKQWGRRWMNSATSASPSASSSNLNAPDNGQTQFQRKGGSRSTKY
jgi:hypothetical protein